MLREIHRLIDETVELTGAPPPASLDATAPTLDEALLALPGGEEPYIVGLIGGKNVGKSSLVNALVGHEITAGSAHGPGTERVIAYAHQAQAAALRELLEREVPGRYEIVSHASESLQRQVLLDLPDFDSHFEEHIEVTRRMLRHMLYPVWLQSVEKYADRQARELLLKVTAGNAPHNFIFVLNKIDQLVAREGEAAAQALREDYATRLARTLKLDAPPAVWMISAVQPDRWDLPALRERLGRQKSVAAVSESKQLALRQHAGSLLGWLETQHLPERLARLSRIEEQAHDEVMQRVAGPVVEQVVPRLVEDRALRWSVADEVMQRRVARWPIVSILHVLLDPVLAAIRWRVPYGQHWAFEGAETLVGQHLDRLAEPLQASLQTTFARLQQSSPLISRLYARRHLWEGPAAQSAAVELRHNLTAAIEHRREEALSQLASGGGAAGWLLRVLLTVGALLWFPIVQPVLEAYLAPGAAVNLGLLLVQVFGVTYLLKNVGFLAAYFVALWLMIRWRSHQAADRWIDRWRRADPLNPEQSLSGQVLEWAQRLLDPIRRAREQTHDLITRVEAIRRKLPPPPARRESPPEPAALARV